MDKSDHFPKNNGGLALFPQKVNMLGLNCISEEVSQFMIISIEYKQQRIQHQPPLVNLECFRLIHHVVQKCRIVG
jgi:hypothetical protein